MKTFARMVAVGALAALGFSARPAEAQVSVGIATPGFALGVGPGAGFIGGGVYPGYPVIAPPIYAPPIYAPRPVVIAPPIYGRPYYGGHAYGYGRGYYPGPRYGYPAHHYR